MSTAKENDGATHSLNFPETLLGAQGSYRDEYQACSSRVLQLSNSAEILPRVASEREQEAASENTLFYHVSQAGIDDRAPFFSCRIRWTPPSFQWHNPGSAWLSLRVRASNYRWCPNIDNFLYVCMHKHSRLRASGGILPQEIFRNEIL